MVDTTKALYDWMVGQSSITDTLGVFAGQPAVFEERIPPGHEITDPVVIIDAPNQDNRSDTSTHIYRDIIIRIRVYARTQTTTGATGTSALHLASETIANALHNARIPVAGAKLTGCKVSGPIKAPTESPSLGGRLITTRWYIQE